MGGFAAHGWFCRYPGAGRGPWVGLQPMGGFAGTLGPIGGYAGNLGPLGRYAGTLESIGGYADTLGP